MYLILCAVVFLFAYTLNVVAITVGYHRGLAHKSVSLTPRLRRALIVGGNWVTGLDPKASGSFGSGYVFGTLLGVMVTGLIQTIIIFQGDLNSAWTRIIVGVLQIFSHL